MAEVQRPITVTQFRAEAGVQTEGKGATGPAAITSPLATSEMADMPNSGRAIQAKPDSTTVHDGLQVKVAQIQHPAPVGPMTVSNTAATLLSGESELGGDPDASLDPILSGDVRTTPGTSEARGTVTHGSAQGQTPQTARQIAYQISAAVARGGDRPIDLTLNPAELGRVRISLSTGDGAMMVSVLAERPETLDLMRRNIDMLAQEMRDIGYDGTGFSFAQGSEGHTGARAGEGRGRDGPNDRAEAGVAMPTIPVVQMPATPTGPIDRLDIRL
jgi:flagellar hook-length control protein FliK